MSGFIKLGAYGLVLIAQIWQGLSNSCFIVNETMRGAG